MLQPFLLAAALLLVGYLYMQLHRMRFQQYANFPQLPSSLLWGHLRALGEAKPRDKPNCHSDFFFIEMYNAIGRPPLMLVDLRTLNPPMVFIANHELAEQITKASQLMPWSLPKSSTLKSLVHVLGPKSILTREGEEWKALRRRFNPAFAPQHLMTLLPCILNKTTAYVQHLENFARSGEAFAFSTLTINLTFDIIGSVVMNEDMKAQKLNESRRGEIIQLYSQLLHTYVGVKADLPWWLIPRTLSSRRRIVKRLDGLLGEVVRAKFAAQKDVDALTPRVLDETIDQIKTFLLAGHDTTSISLAWSMYEIWRTPRVLQALRDELDDLFGKGTGPKEVYEKLLSPEGKEIVRNMPYISAIIKVVLRIVNGKGQYKVKTPLYNTGKLRPNQSMEP